LLSGLFSILQTYYTTGPWEKLITIEYLQILITCTVLSMSNCYAKLILQRYKPLGHRKHIFLTWYTTTYSARIFNASCITTFLHTGPFYNDSNNTMVRSKEQLLKTVLLGFCGNSERRLYLQVHWPIPAWMNACQRAHSCRPRRPMPLCQLGPPKRTSHLTVTVHLPKNVRLSLPYYIA
jgi:hypothetical protein